MPFSGATFTKLFSWLTDPVRNEKIFNSRLDDEFDGIATGLTTVATAASIVPQGRLTLTQGVARPTTDVSGATTIYLTPAAGDAMPSYDGTNWTNSRFAELSNITTNSATGNAGPAAVEPHCAYHMFAWKNSGTWTLTRGPKHTKSATVTITNASPAVVTWTLHGLREGAPVIFTTSGSLPTGVTAGTVYFVGRSPAGNTFNISTSVANAAAGTFVNTSSAGSGTHTGTNNDTTAGTGAGTSETQTVNGLPTNKFAITNGPAANRGLWVGTVRANASSTIDFTFGSDAAGGGEAVLGVWNAWNPILFKASVGDSSAMWTYTLSTIRPMNNSVTNRVSFVSGQALMPYTVMRGYYTALVAVAGGFTSVGYLLNGTNSYTNQHTFLSNAAEARLGAQHVVGSVGEQSGFNYIQACERSDGVNAHSFAGTVQGKRFEVMLWQ